MSGHLTTLFPVTVPESKRKRGFYGMVEEILPLNKSEEKTRQEAEDAGD